MEKADISLINEGLKGIFDSHCHYDDRAFDPDREEVLDGLMSENSPVEYLMHACTDLTSAEYGLKISRKYRNYYTSVGIHPEVFDAEYGIYRGGLPDDYLKKIAEFADDKKVRAIGEIGLDYHYNGYDKAAQISLFTEQLELANKLDLPVIMHCRDATEDFVRICKEYRPKGVCHCFNGSPETAMQLVEMGLYIGFTGVLAFKNSKKEKNVFLQVPRERILFETDAPYMSPPPFRGKRCQSEMIAYVAREAERLTGTSAQEFINITNENARRLFSIET